MLSLPVTPSPISLSRCGTAAVLGAWLVLFSIPSFGGGGSLSAEASPQPASLTVQFGETTTSLPVLAVLAMPEERVRVSAATDHDGSRFRVHGNDHIVMPLDVGKWRVRVPSTPGHFPLTVVDTTRADSVRLQVFVLRPWNHEGRVLDGYRIGRYRQSALRGRERYRPPQGFIRVTADNRRVRVSPHFRLEQFLCKQTDETPQYVLVQPRLLQTLERILAALNERGHSLSTLHVMSGFRTPYYNRSIGNTTSYSRHLYGDAADIFVDANGDGWMDDLTGDGRATRADARYLAKVVRRVPTEGKNWFVGGLGIYGPASHRGPFVHLDLRGRQARW